MRSKSALLLPGLILVASLALASGKSQLGPLASHTNADSLAGKPMESNCTECHLDNDFLMNGQNFNTPGGGLQFLGLPEAYIAGKTYVLGVQLDSDSTRGYPGRKWGFQITAVRASDGEGCGTFLLMDPDTLQIINGDPSLPFESRQYVEHTYLATRDSLDGPVMWEFLWKAPNPPEGTVYFFLAGVAGNGSEEPSGDFVYTARDSVLDETTPVLSTSWGSVKARYR